MNNAATLQLGDMDKEFMNTLKERSGQNPVRCIQCGKCTAGCPASFAYDYSVSQIMRLAQEGRKEELLSCRSIWLCLSCHTCSTRCPMEIDVAAVLETLRHMALEQGRVTVKNVNKFHQSFLDSATKHGRIHELGIMLDYMRRSGKVFTDIDLGPKILGLRKLSFQAHNIKGKEEVQAIVKRFEAKHP